MIILIISNDSLFINICDNDICDKWIKAISIYRSGFRMNIEQNDRMIMIVVILCDNREFVFLLALKNCIFFILFYFIY